jgi:hypothetical protein
MALIRSWGVWSRGRLRSVMRSMAIEGVDCCFILGVVVIVKILLLKSNLPCGE